MTEYRKCAQCGRVLPEDNYKIKYTRKNGTYCRNRFCRACEDDTRTYNRLLKLTEEEASYPYNMQQLADYNKAFQRLEQQGLSTPLSRQKRAKPKKLSILERIDELEMQGILSKENTSKVESTPYFKKPALEPAVSPIEFTEHDIVIEDTVDVATTIPDGTNVPQELLQWLHPNEAQLLVFDEWQKLGYEPGYLNEMVYPTLKAAFRPEIGWNDETMAPIYDDTFKEVLNAISKMFWDYEDYCFRARASVDDTDKEEVQDNGN